MRSDSASLVARSEQGALRLDAEAVAMRVGDKQILAETTLSVEPGQLVAFIGESSSRFSKYSSTRSFSAASGVFAAGLVAQPQTSTAMPPANSMEMSRYFMRGW